MLPITDLQKGLGFQDLRHKASKPHRCLAKAIQKSPSLRAQDCASSSIRTGQR